MKANLIERRLLLDLHKRSTVLPRFAPGGWWECDVLELTKSGYLREFEIKVDRADYRADGKKWQPGRCGRELKHELLVQPDPSRTPNRFCFVMPCGLVDLAEVPEWAGLIYVRRRANYHRMPYALTLETVRAAPWLHRRKAPDLLRARMHETAWWRLMRRTIYDNENYQTEWRPAEGGAVPEHGSEDGGLRPDPAAVPG